MAIEYKTVLDRIDPTENGTLLVRFQKQKWEGGKMTWAEWHRTTIPPGTDSQAQLARVNTHLKAMGMANMGFIDMARVDAAVKEKHTPGVIQAYRDKQETAMKAKAS